LARGPELRVRTARRRLADRRRLAAISLAILAHAALFSLLLSGTGRLPYQPTWQERPTEVWLAPPVTLRRPPLERLRPSARHSAPKRAETVAARPPGPQPSTQAPLSAPSVAAPSATIPDVGGALRKWVGCAQPGAPWMTQADRAACAVRLAANRPATPTPLNLDPQGRYVSNPEPYLTRMPKNGCKVRAAGDAGPMGQQGVAAGVSCGLSF
jgi:hypothetical protein